jgi:hypothetical protein
MKSKKPARDNQTPAKAGRRMTQGQWEKIAGARQNAAADIAREEKKLRPAKALFQLCEITLRLDDPELTELVAANSGVILDDEIPF